MRGITVQEKGGTLGHYMIPLACPYNHRGCTAVAPHTDRGAHMMRQTSCYCLRHVPVTLANIFGVIPARGRQNRRKDR